MIWERDRVTKSFPSTFLHKDRGNLYLAWHFRNACERAATFSFPRILDVSMKGTATGDEFGQGFPSEILAAGASGLDFFYDDTF